ncbi:MAG: formylglycine-generating enzyme family protein [Rhodobacteraceae bacterium]|nr:MAG: formylglycine-generating enzyme family protein [Paracoccaceae bacterium]
MPETPDTPGKTGCCPPPTPARAHPPRTPRIRPASAPRPPSVEIPGGRALLGTDRPVLAEDAEGPLRRKTIAPFRIGVTTVTNAQFAAFIEETGHVTEAERFGWSFVFWSQVPSAVGPTQGVVDVEWWRRVDGATWRDINGPGTAEAAWHPDHPVVHVSWNDARAYAEWIGGRLPTEAEWEHAARGGLGDVRFPWGDDEPDDTGHFPCNIWQGRFPQTNLALDGHLTTAPAQSFAPNGYGLYNLVGNVWEWTSEPFRIRSLRRQAKARQAAMKGYKLSKGGSFLCHKSYCYRYRIAARTGNSPDSTTTHSGFRVVWDL